MAGKSYCVRWKMEKDISPGGHVRGRVFLDGGERSSASAVTKSSSSFWVERSGVPVGITEQKDFTFGEVTLTGETVVAPLSALPRR